MSAKTRTRKNRTTSPRNTTALRSVTDQGAATKARTDTESKLWKALHANPNSTATDLAHAAAIGKSTAGKILAKWHKVGTVTRTPGIAEGGRRAADLWAIAQTNSTDRTVDTTEADSTPIYAADLADTDRSDAKVRASTPESIPDPNGAATPDGGITEPTGATVDHEPSVSDPTRNEAIVADGTAQHSDGDSVKGSSSDGKKERLAAGALRGMVEDHLRDHPGEAFGPTAIAKALGGKSSGAVSNALDKLVADGTAVKTQESPRRYALASAEQAASSTRTQ